MSEIPPVRVIDYESPAPGPARGRAVLAWGIIWLAVVFALVRGSTPRERDQTGETVNQQLTAVARIVVGAHLLLEESDPAAADRYDALLVKQVDTPAKNVREKLGAAVVAGEIVGAPAALKRLDEIEPDTLSAEQHELLADLRTVYTNGAGALQADSSQRLVDRLGYFGRLAMHFEAPATDPQRQQLVEESRGKALRAGVAVLILLGIVALGVVLFVVAIVLAASGKIRRAYVPRAEAPTVYVEMFAAYVLATFAFSALLGLLPVKGLALPQTWLITQVLPLAVAIGWGLRRGVRGGDMRQALGLHGGRGWYVEIPMGILGYLAGLPLLVCAFLITALLVNLSGVTPTHPVQQSAMDAGWKILQVLLLASVGAPIIEEIMFRGALQHHLRRRWGFAASAALVAFIFAAIHPQGWTTIPALGMIAFILAALREWRGSILAPMAAHGFSNGVVMTLFLLTR
jgi:membrane protease YdiL (CAAX protease family)